MFNIPPATAAGFPPYVKAAVYYPFQPPVIKGEVAIPRKGPFPVLLYAHAYRGFLFANAGAHTADRDFTSVATILEHVACYGCVCIAPDLNWLTDEWASGATLTTSEERGVLLVNYYEYLSSLNTSVFHGQLDLSRVILAGHSTGAGGAVQAGLLLGGFGNAIAPIYGLIAPEEGGGTISNVSRLLVVGGTLDTDQGADPEAGYNGAGTPKTLVTIPGANHFGYTDICNADNACESAELLENGTIPRLSQQMIAAAYLAALVRYYALSDATARPYLSGAQAVEGLGHYGTSDVQVQSQGIGLHLPPGPFPTIVPRRQ